MSINKTKMEVIIIESEAFYKLLEKYLLYS